MTLEGQRSKVKGQPAMVIEILWTR